MQAVIMAGGKGTRLNSVTKDQIPKPMVRIGKKPILEYQINTLKENRITDIWIIMGPLHEIIEDYFGDGSKWGVQIHYFIEQEAMGTGGGGRHLPKVSGGAGAQAPALFPPLFLWEKGVSFFGPFVYNKMNMQNGPLCPTRSPAPPGEEEFP